MKFTVFDAFPGFVQKTTDFDTFPGFPLPGPCFGVQKNQ